MAYCTKCELTTDYIVKTVDLEIEIKDQTIGLPNAQLAFCVNCNEEIFVEHIDSKNQEEAFNIYRKIKGLIAPSEIKKIRSAYGINQRVFSKLLGFGEITITRYENGSLPTFAQSQAIKASEDPKVMLNLLNFNSTKIESHEAEKLNSHLKSILNSPKETAVTFLDELINKYGLQKELKDDLKRLRMLLTTK